MRKSAVGRRYLSNPFLFLLSLAAFLLAPSAAEAGGVHPQFNLQSVSQSPFPSDRFTVPDPSQRTNLRVNLPSPNCATHPSDCLDVALLNQLDGFNTQPRISIPFDGAIDPGTVTSETVFILRIGNLSDPADFRPQTVGINQVVWDPATLTLFVQSDEHLAQDTRYLLVVTDGVRDAAGDPVSWAPFIRKSPLEGQAAKAVIVQFARGDRTVPNPTTTALIRSGDLADRTTLFRNDLAFALGVGFGKNPHTFLTSLGGTPPVAQAAVAAQNQIALFFAPGGTTTIDPDGAGPLFETPISIPLPEDLAFIP